MAVLPAGAAGAAGARIMSGLPNIGGGPEATTGAATNYYFEWGKSAPGYGTTTQVETATTSMVSVPAVSEAVEGIAKGDHLPGD